MVIGSTALRKISIGSKISEIGYSAFYRCEMLDTIECLSSVPPTVGIDAFTYVNKSIPVFVHCEVLSLYQAAEGRREFTNFQCMSVGEEIIEDKM